MLFLMILIIIGNICHLLAEHTICYLQNNPRRQIICFKVYKWETWGTERASDLLKVTQLEPQFQPQEPDCSSPGCSYRTLPLHGRGTKKHKTPPCRELCRMVSCHELWPVQGQREMERPMMINSQQSKEGPQALPSPRHQNLNEVHLKFNFKGEVTIRSKRVLSFSNNVKREGSFVKIHALLFNNRKMNWLVDHPKQLIHLVRFVNMPHFSHLKSGSSRSSYDLGECVAWRAARRCFQTLAR